MPSDQTTAAFTIRRGGDGEMLVIAPDGRVQFMGLWRCICFIWKAVHAGKRIEVSDD